MTIGERLNLFACSCYRSQYNFANYLGISKSYLNRIINEKINTGLDIISKFISSGVSVNWLLEGKGSMFANNNTGMNLKNKLISSGTEPGTLMSVRLLSWICENYDNLERFCNFLKIDFYKYYKIIFEDSIPDTEFIDTVRKAGCNIDWLYTGKGSCYNNNPSGTILQFRKLNKNNKVIDSLEKEDFETKEIDSMPGEVILPE
ncbi:MAG: hypothetical protein A2X61_04675 [Ignavibacteria bacterium GWB2_35_12]|nr:MAG: hypothetical protein A2X61_04675 [Ignavibacteria bacterium GWB2_35_12]OGU88936.1 MAG: hypothetical protein A2220_06685 [Ignavibacteria bacterium RIFOXYA2_FULL_35_10]OGV24600.1 MAG: hypothetical protein A2475_09270 [Ignavibacteria bacterium RIFOXYC2_FULL_35_21]